jgi:hypothetical protein
VIFTSQNHATEENEMSTLKRDSVTDAETLDSHWHWLYRAGGAAALITALFIPIQIIVFALWPPPSTIADWFALLQNNRLVGLIDLDLLLIVDQALLIPILLALYIALKRADESWMAIGTALGLIGIASYVASNPAFAMLSLSDQYAAAATDAQRAMNLAAGQAMLAMFQGTAFTVYYVLGSVAPIIISAVMLTNSVFSKATAYLGILANVVALGFFLPTIGLLLAILSVVLLEIWYILIARSLLQIRQSGASLVSGATSA